MDTEVTPQNDMPLDPYPMDALLQSLVTFVSTDANNLLGITLSVGGMLISGKLVPGDVYCKALYKKIGFNEEEGLDSDNFLGAYFYHTALDYQKKRTLKDKEPRLYIHLLDCYCYSPGGQIGTYLGEWRGRLTSVIGFSLGEMIRPQTVS